MEKQLPAFMRKQYADYSSFAGQTIEQVFGKELDRATKFSANTLSSAMLINSGKGNYRISKLPIQLQWSPIFSFLTDDFNADHKTDIISAGNFYGALPYEGRYDANHGDVLINKSGSSFNILPSTQSGVQLEGEIRDMKYIQTSSGKIIVVARNNRSLLFYRQIK